MTYKDAVNYLTEKGYGAYIRDMDEEAVIKFAGEVKEQDYE